MAIENGVLKPSGALQIRGGTWEALEAENPVLARRELCVEFNGDTIYLKVGNGEDNYLDLPYVGENFGGSADLPNDEDGTVYVVQDGSWVSATLVEQPSEWSPQIDDTEEIVLAVDEDMMPYQLYGNNTEVNS